MHILLSSLLRRLSSEDGQALAEYGLIIAFVAIVSVVALAALAVVIVDPFNQVGDAFG